MKVVLYLLSVGYFLHTAPKATHPVISHSGYISKSFFRFGDQLITLEKYAQTTERSYVLVNLHSNESAAIRTSMLFARARGAEFFRLENKNRKNVEADFFDKKVSFDPNHIFSNWGRRTNLKMNKCFDRAAEQRIHQLAQFLTSEVVRDKTVVSLHTDDQQGVDIYKEGGKLAKYAREVSCNPALDVNDFFITSEESIYIQLKERQFNVVLQNKSRLNDDGSLGVYCIRAGKAFVNIETKAEHTGEQQRMLAALDAILQ